MSPSLRTRTISLIAILCVVLGVWVLATAPTSTFSFSSTDLRGYAWSDNIGWISMNCIDEGCDDSNYKVTIKPDKSLEGYAWSDAVGWIEFGGLSGFPIATTSGNAHIEGNKVVGWARVVNGDDVTGSTSTTTTQVYATPTSGTDFTVPAGVTEITVKAWGGGGGSGASDGGTGLGGAGGGSGYARIANIPVVAGEPLSIRVGGGGGGGPNTRGGGGGGGYSGVFRSSTPLIIAGGGGGGGASRSTTQSGGAGGVGGGLSAASGTPGIGGPSGIGEGGGGTQNAGGVAFMYVNSPASQNKGVNGSSLSGGAGGTNAGTFGGGGTGGTSGGAAGGLISTNGGSGGGGGGGYYGGGGGAGGFTIPAGAGGGGGGGSGYVSIAGTLTVGSGVTPANSGDASYVSGVGVGGASGNPWDISKAVYLQNKSISAQDTFSRAVFFRSDGLKMYTPGALAAEINEFTLSTAWDVTTATYLQRVVVSAQNDQPDGLFFDPTGTKMYVTGLTDEEVNEYSLSTAWNVTTATFVRMLSVAADSESPTSIFFNPTGTKMFIDSTTNDEINEYNLSTPWNISTASLAQSFSTASQTGSPRSVFFRSDGLMMYITGNNADSEINQYALSSAWDVTSASFVRVLSLATQDTAIEGVFFKPDGTKMYIVGNINDRVNEYDFNIGSGNTGGPGLVSITYTQTLPTLQNGWDGWISLSCTNTDTCNTSPYGVSVGIGALTSFGWGSEVMGWMKFDPPYTPVTFTPPCTPGNTCTTASSSRATDQWCETTDTECPVGYQCVVGTGLCDGVLEPTGTLTLSPQKVRKNAPTQISWTSQNALACSVEGANGDTKSGGTTGGPTPSVPIVGQTTYTLSCTDALGAGPFDIASATVKLIPAFEEI